MCRATAILFSMLMMVVVHAQTPGPAGSNPPVPSSQSIPSGTSQSVQSATIDQIAAGTEIRATLDTPLSTKTSKPGDRFTATIAEPARGINGVVIPAGARVEGEVAEAEDSK